jgi:Flp pilus assembly protein TadG
MNVHPLTLTEIRRDARGTTAVEFGLTGPIFFMVVVGVIEGGLMLWTQVGLQHGTEMAARYASVTATCSGTPPTPTPPSASAIKAYAAQQSFGLSPATSNFTFTTPLCGYQVSASYSFPFTAYFPNPLTLSAQACFPGPSCT